MDVGTQTPPLTGLCQHYWHQTWAYKFGKTQTRRDMNLRQTPGNEIYDVWQLPGKLFHIKGRPKASGLRGEAAQGPHKHKDPRKHDFWYPPSIGPWSQNLRSLCLCGLCCPFRGLQLAPKRQQTISARGASMSTSCGCWRRQQWNCPAVVAESRHVLARIQRRSGLVASKGPRHRLC